TVKVTALLAPPAVVAVMLCAPVAAFAAITRVAVIWVAVTVGAAAVVMPAGRFSVAPVRLVPVRVTATLAPTAPEVGAIEASAGRPEPTTVKVSGLLVPAGIVAVMFCAPAGALAAITRVARIRVELVFNVPAATVIPVGRFRVAPSRLVP